MIVAIIANNNGYITNNYTLLIAINVSAILDVSVDTVLPVVVYIHAVVCIPVVVGVPVVVYVPAVVGVPVVVYVLVVFGVPVAVGVLVATGVHSRHCSCSE